MPRTQSPRVARRSPSKESLRNDPTSRHHSCSSRSPRKAKPASGALHSNPLEPSPVAPPPVLEARQPQLPPSMSSPPPPPPPPPPSARVSALWVTIICLGAIALMAMPMALTPAMSEHSPPAVQPIQVLPIRTPPVQTPPIRAAPARSPRRPYAPNARRR